MAETALLVVDMLSAYRHDDADILARNTSEIVGPLADLIGVARDRDDVDLIYVNDNYGDFAAQPSDLVRSALEGARPDLVQPLVPHENCMIITKVRHSVFYSTALEYLLGRLGTNRIVLTGQVTEQCILYSALDAYVRHFTVVVPPDAVAHIDPELGAAAMHMMQRNMSAKITPTENCLASR